MSLDCYCNYDPPEVYSSRIVKARKEYRCYECSQKISVGESHEYAFGISDGYAYQARTCSHCVDIRQFVVNNIPCFCWAHGNLIDDARTIIDEAYFQAPDEVAGLRFGFGRLLVKAKRARASANHFSNSLPLTPEASKPAGESTPPSSPAGTNSEAQP